MNRHIINPRRHALALACGLACALPAFAMELASDDPDTKIRLDFTPKYSLAYRLKDPSALLTSPAARGDGGVTNENDGDLNFGQGVVSNRVDLLSEFDYSRGNWGLRLSHAAWYDSKYLSRNDNPGTMGVSNQPGQPANEFIPATRSRHGRGGEVLDAFVYAKGSVGELPGSIRIGKHALQYGESLFFGQNGIANAQGPVDVAKIVSVPNWQFKEVLLPVEQVSGSLQVAEGVTLGGYYQFKWRPSKIPGVGSYFSNQDYIGGGQVFFGPPLPPVLVTDNSKDQRPGDSGQFGAQLRWSPAGSDYEFGFYAARYHDKTPAVPVFDLVNGNVHQVYAEGIKTVGASVTSSIGQLNWALEGSVRQNTPLASAGQASLATIRVNTGLNNNSNPGYAVGETAHAQLSWIASLGPSFLSREASFVGEVAWNQRTKVTRNAQMLNPNADKSATGVRMVYSPSYRQVLPGLDLSPSIGLGYTKGKSSAVGPGFGVDGGGDLSLGLNAVYLGVWNLGVNYVHFLGKAAPTLDANNNAVYQQALKDRNYLTVSLRTTF